MPAHDGNGTGRRSGNGRGAARDLRAGRGVRERTERGERRVSRVGRAAGHRTKGHGTLMIIGGHEDKDERKLILRAFAARAGTGRAVVATVASSEPDAMWATYEPVLRGLGLRHVWHLDVRSRDEAMQERALRVLDGATAVFFTGGDQLKITSQLGDTPVYERLRAIFEGGGLVAGTSAGASVMCETMLVGGGDEGSSRVRSSLRMAPGFGLVDGIIIDQHFAERGRMSRLLGAVAQNPRIVGIGIDENTSIIYARRSFTVLGEGAVYVVDGRRVSYSNLSEEDPDRVLSLYDARLHVLSQGDRFSLNTRRPKAFPAEEIEAELVGTRD